jgi:hypothetical protein
MSIIRHKDGHPNVNFFESIETLNQFDRIRKSLQKKVRLHSSSFVILFLLNKYR